MFIIKTTMTHSGWLGLQSISTQQSNKHVSDMFIIAFITHYEFLDRGLHLMYFFGPVTGW